MSLPTDHAQCIARAAQALDGLSVGDALGHRFFGPDQYILPLLRNRDLPPAPWYWTDDTAMALSIFEVLNQQGRINPDPLAQAFARRYTEDDRRGYGAGAHMILTSIAAGQDWRDVSHRVFSGMGSMGNGGAMRVAPVGAYFADDYTTAAENARFSALPTHAHPEGQAGAIAIAVATAWAHQSRERSSIDAADLFKIVLAQTPDGQTRANIAVAADIPLAYDPRTVVSAAGNGSRLSAPDTVPLCLWLAARHMNDYAEAIWQTIACGGDIDTNCAIVGGIVAMSAPIPPEWLAAREPLLL
jgi:ADP-ribosylglycohydrolase